MIGFKSSLVDISQLEIHGEVVSQEDANLKLLRSSPSAWNNIALIMRNKSDLDTLSMVNTAHSISVASSKDQDSTASYVNDVMFSFFTNQSNALQLDSEDLEQIDVDDLEEMDLKWQVAMLNIRVKRFIKKSGRKLDLNGKETVGFDRTKVECYNYHKRGHFAIECRAPRNQGNRNRDDPRRNALVDTSTTNALVVQDGIGGYDWSFQAKEGITNFALMAYTSQGSSSSSSSDFEREALNKSNQEITGYQIGLESLEARIVVHEKNKVAYEEDIAFLKYDVQVKDISIKDLKNQLEEALKEKDDLKLKLEKFEESSKNLTKLINSQVTAKDKTGLGPDEQVNESEVLDNVFDSHESDRDDNPVNDRFKKVEGYYTVPPPYTGNYMPSKPDLSFAGLDNSVYKTKVSETITTASKTSKDSLEKPKTVRPSAPIIEEWDTDSDNDRQVPVNVAKQSSPRVATLISTTRPVNTATPKSKGNPKYTLHDQGIFDSRCSRHMTGNKSFLIDYQDIDGGFVAFAGCAKGEKSVLFTETEYLVLSPDFKLLDESQVLLKAPKQNNMYSFDLKNIVPLGGLTCLFEKATINESNLWHRRLGHINFKTMNKLLRGNLVRVLPSKLFENDQTCVACQKGKQHKASYKTGTMSSIYKPLQLLHMDLFGPVSMKSINKKSYCLVVIDEFSRLSWVFFLATKDETNEILKNFITRIENQTDHKVKTIRYDNGTEFKNRIINEFYEIKGIRREFSVARTP
ncbi:putative ribonuclease H-like domain-containing protein [Tanacetum coccineum]